MPKSSQDIIRQLKQDGWFLAGVTGDHHHFKHPTKLGKVTIPHPVKDIKTGTLKSIEKQSQTKLQ